MKKIFKLVLIAMVFLVSTIGGSALSPVKADSGDFSIDFITGKARVITGSAFGDQVLLRDELTGLLFYCSSTIKVKTGDMVMYRKSQKPPRKSVVVNIVGS